MQMFDERKSNGHLNEDLFLHWGEVYSTIESSGFVYLVYYIIVLNFMFTLSFNFYVQLYYSWLWYLLNIT